jgi:hypothetical protein
MCCDALHVATAVRVARVRIARRVQPSGGRRSRGFEGTRNPHEINNDSNGPARVVASGNVNGTSGARDTRGTVFTLPYAYMLDPASQIPASVRQGAGPR